MRVDEGQTTVWCLLGKKAGDNTQVRALADELGCGYQEKHIVARHWELLVHLGSDGTLSGIDRDASSSLTAPWPDLVISAGRRNEPVARWIRQQSGGRTRLVHMGRPWAPPESWDLLITTPQYFLPERDNILHNSLPLHRVESAAQEAAAVRWQPLLEDLPRPWIAVFVGGDSGRFVLTANKGEALGRLVDDLAGRSGGSLLVTDSARTPQAAGDALAAVLTVPHVCHRVAAGEENPYAGFLALADAFVVTGESMSMLGEAVAAGRPLYIFDVGDGPVPWWRIPHNYRYKPLSHHFAMRFGPRRMRRDVGRIQDALVADGSAQWLDEQAIAAEAGVVAQMARAGDVAQRELSRAAEAVRRLLKPH